MAKFFRVLGDPTRLKVLYLLREHEHTVSEMAEILGVLQPRLSSHLACLRWCGLVGQRKEGKLTYYYLSDEHILNILDMADAFLQDNATNIGLCTIVDRSS
jgi:DNA-binding transcriptional ArsR family regulator